MLYYFMWKPVDTLIMTEVQRRTLEAWVRAKKTSQRVVLRSRICLYAGEGLSHNAIAKRLKTSRPTVLLWTNRFREQGTSRLSEDTPHGISSRRLDPEKVHAIVEATPQQATGYHWFHIIPYPPLAEDIVGTAPRAVRSGAT